MGLLCFRGGVVKVRCVLLCLMCIRLMVYCWMILFGFLVLLLLVRKVWVLFNVGWLVKGNLLLGVKICMW